MQVPVVVPAEVQEAVITAAQNGMVKNTTLPAAAVVVAAEQPDILLMVSEPVEPVVVAAVPVVPEGLIIRKIMDMVDRQPMQAVMAVAEPEVVELP